MSEFKPKKYKRISNTGFANYALLEHIEKLDGYRIKCYEEHGLLFYCAVYPTVIEAIDMLQSMDFELIYKIYE